MDIRLRYGHYVRLGHERKFRGALGSVTDIRLG